jgi:hypothetical protein
MVVLWNHGSGWDDTNVYRMVRDDLGRDVTRKAEIIGRAAGESAGSVPSRHIRRISAGPLKRAVFDTGVRLALNTRAIAFDDQAKDFIDNQELKKVVTDVKKKLKKKIDILGMDACLMNMAEVAYQLQGSVAFTVGSEETEPGNGWPYDRILAELVKKPDMTPRDLSKVIVERYLASYGKNEGVTQSALDLAGAGGLGTACDQLATALTGKLTDGPVRAALLTARNQVQSYEVADYVDLADLATLIGQGTAKPAITRACGDLIDAVCDDLVVKSGYRGASMAHSKGVSIYFPLKGISSLYPRLDFARNTAWNEFLTKFQAALKRREK